MKLFRKNTKALPLILAAILITGCTGTGTVTDAPPEEDAVTVPVTDASADNAGPGNDFLTDAASAGRTSPGGFPLLDAGAGSTGAQFADPLADPGSPGSGPAGFPLGGSSAAGENTEAPENVVVNNRLDQREDPDTALKESVLFQALVECTGWGQSAGSSLRAASAATELLRWANEAEAAAADPEILEAAAADEISRLTPEEQADLVSNWSSISYDVSMILDDFDEITLLLEDAGSLESAREASENKKALDNWRAASKAIEAAMDKAAPLPLPADEGSTTDIARPVPAGQNSLDSQDSQDEDSQEADSTDPDHAVVADPGSAGAGTGTGETDRDNHTSEEETDSEEDSVIVIEGE